MALQLEELAALSGLGLVAAGVVWSVTISSFPQAAAWRRRRQHFAEIAQKNGLTVDPLTCTARGDLQGWPFSAGLHTDDKGSKGVVEAWARLELDDCPDGLLIAEQTFFTGLRQVTGARDLRIGDAELDAVFYISSTASVEEIQAFLTPSVRAALLVDVPWSRRPGIADKAIVSSRVFLTPLGMRRHFETVFDGYQVVARALNGSYDTPASKAVARKLRRFSLGTLGLWCPAFFLALAAGGDATAETWMLCVGLLFLMLLTLAVYRGSEVGRVLLQGAYAVMALACGSAGFLALVEFAELTPWRLFKLDEDNAAAFFVLDLLLLLLFWSGRHYLKALDSSGSIRRGLQKATGDQRGVDL